jgi:hypothetical protein
MTGKGLLRFILDFPVVELMSKPFAQDGSGRVKNREIGISAPNPRSELEEKQ